MDKDLRDRIGARRVILFSGTLYFISQAAIGIILHPLDPLLFVKAQTTFSPEVFLNLFARWEAADLIPRYRLHFYLDFLHPVWYAVFLSALLARGLKLNAAAGTWNFFLFLPFAAGCLDITENVFHLQFIRDIGTVTRGRIFTSALAANLKWALAGISLLGVAVMYARHLAGFGKRRRT